jgi:hypothetical protein
MDDVAGDGVKQRETLRALRGVAVNGVKQRETLRALRGVAVNGVKQRETLRALRGVVGDHKGRPYDLPRSPIPDPRSLASSLSPLAPRLPLNAIPDDVDRGATG